jgi:hypothetical protein
VNGIEPTLTAATRECCSGRPQHIERGPVVAALTPRPQSRSRRCAPLGYEAR